MGGKLSFFRFNSLLFFYSTEILFHFLGKEEDLLQKGDCPFFKEDKVSRLTFVIANKITISIYDWKDWTWVTENYASVKQF